MIFFIGQLRDPIGEGQRLPKIFELERFFPDANRPFLY